MTFSTVQLSSAHNARYILEEYTFVWAASVL